MLKKVLISVSRLSLGLGYFHYLTHVRNQNNNNILLTKNKKETKTRDSFDMSEFDQLVNTFKKLDISDDAEYIQRPYPGAFYRKTFDDGKIKVFQRSNTTKVYFYPTFKPKSPKVLSNTNDNNFS